MPRVSLRTFFRADEDRENDLAKKRRRARFRDASRSNARKRRSTLNAHLQRKLTSKVTHVYLSTNLSVPLSHQTRSAKIYGTSGGALTGCLLFLDIDLDALAEYVYICVAKARSSWRGKFLLRDYCRGAIEQFCTKDAHKILQGRFEMSITQIFPWYKNLRVNQFPTYEFLVQSLLCSACLVPLAGFPMWLPGYGLCFDGGVSDFQLFKGLSRHGTFCKLHCRKTNPKDIVVICPFYSSRADIRPSKFVPIWWAFFPPEPYKLKELFELGVKDAHAWADKQEESTPDSSPRGATHDAFDVCFDEKEHEIEAEKENDGSDNSDDDWQWRRREKAAVAAAKGGAKAGAAAWRESGPQSDSRWWTYGARQTQPVRRRRGEETGEEKKNNARASVTRELPPANSPTRRSFDGGFFSRGSRRDDGNGNVSSGSGGSGGFTGWAVECQEWASLSAEAATRRALDAARAAAIHAADFARTEQPMLGPNVHNDKGRFCEQKAAAEAMRRVADQQTERRAREGT